ncbi:MAG: DUF3152 domain-containing protein [Bifidobacteriaceae bacterium]|nr:DUF3152 domain-containing protein [Bifidobacteriaceae bacterium]
MTQTPSAPATPSATQSPAAPEADGPAGVVNAIKARATVKYAVSSRGEVTVPLDQFRAEVATILDDPLGWRGIGIVFMEVGETAEADITVWLTEPAKVPSFASICSSNLSCSIGSNIIINEERWLTGALPGAMDDVPIEAYRMMVVNHEVGHWLGHHEHSACPGEGEIAPLMMQQSKGLDGCIFNPYPLPDEANAPDLGLD